jgi:hypothetical protein
MKSKNLELIKLFSTQKLKKKLQEEDLKLQKELTLGGSALGTGN